MGKLRAHAMRGRLESEFAGRSCEATAVYPLNLTRIDVGVLRGIPDSSVVFLAA